MTLRSPAFPLIWLQTLKLKFRFFRFLIRLFVLFLGLLTRFSAIFNLISDIRCLIKSLGFESNLVIKVRTHTLTHTHSHTHLAH